MFQHFRIILFSYTSFQNIASFPKAFPLSPGISLRHPPKAPGKPLSPSPRLPPASSSSCRVSGCSARVRCADSAAPTAALCQRPSGAPMTDQRWATGSGNTWIPTANWRFGEFYHNLRMRFRCDLWWQSWFVSSISVEFMVSIITVYIYFFSWVSH